MSKRNVITLMITEDCNLNCSYCYFKRNVNTCRSMDKKLIDEIINFIHHNYDSDEIMIFNFLGGEPLLKLDLIKYFIENIDSRFNNTSYGITTNGSMINEKNIAFLSSVFNSHFSISIDGEFETHTNTRKGCTKDLYNKIIDNATKIILLSDRLRIRMTITKDEIENIFNNVKYLIEKGFRRIVPVLDFENIDYNDKDIIKIKNQFNMIKDYLKRNNLIDVINMKQTSNELYTLSSCKPGKDYFCINCVGDFFPCSVTTVEELKIGDLKNGFDNKKLEDIYKVNSSEMENCKGCSAYLYCTATRCKCINLVTMGDYYKPNIASCVEMNAILG